MDIVDAIKKDREKGAERLESEYKATLLAFARRLCTNESDAEDLVYRMFSDVVAGIDGYTEQSAFLAWMSKILANRHSNDVRRKSNIMEILGEDVSDAADDGASRVFDAVDATFLREAVDSLPRHLREAVVLRYFMDLPLLQVAKILSLPIGTIKSRLYYARMVLGKRLGATLNRPVVRAVLLLVVGALFGVWFVASRHSVGDGPGAANVASGAEGNADDAYLESNGSQAVILDYRVNAKTRIVVDFQLTSTNSLCRKILGAFSDDDNSHRASLWYNGYGNIEFNIAGNWRSTKIKGDLGRHVATIDLPNRWLAYDGWRQRLCDEMQGWGAGESYPLGLFAENKSDMPTNIQMSASVRIYSLDIYEDDILIRRYRPVVKGERVGLLDAVSGRFAVSQMPLACGGAISRLPDDLHLQSDRTQMIALDYAINADTRLEVDYALVNWTRGGSTLFGTANLAPEEAFRCMYWVSGGGNMQFNVNGAWIPSFTGAGIGRHVAVLDFPKMRVEYVTGEMPVFVRDIPPENGFTDARKALPIMFFGENWGDPLCRSNHNNRTVAMKLYSVKAYEHGRLVRDYRPALRDGVACLHDEVTGAFCGDPRDDAPFLVYGGQLPLDKIFGLMMVFR